MKRGKYTILILVITASIIVFLLLNLLLGSVSIPFASVWNILTGGEGDPIAWQNIICLLYTSWGIIFYLVVYGNGSQHNDWNIQNAHDNDGGPYVPQ